MAKVIKKTEARRQTEKSLELYHQAHQRLNSNAELPTLQSGTKNDLMLFVNKRIDEMIAKLI